MRCIQILFLGQFGSEIGADNGGAMNGLCNDKGDDIISVPVDSLCPSRWFVWNAAKKSWVLDETMSVRCIGNDTMYSFMVRLFKIIYTPQFINRHIPKYFIFSLDPCEPHSEEACRKSALKTGLTLGGNGYEFAGSSYGEKGCYSYKSKSSKYYGIAWYGLGGDKKKISKPYDGNSEYFRPEGYDCVVKSN